MPKQVKSKDLVKIEITSEITTAQEEELISILVDRFEKNTHRHSKTAWEQVHDRLILDKKKLVSLWNMENTGGEPDVVDIESVGGGILFCDCSTESPTGRRNTCYDSEGEELRLKKGVVPAGNAVDLAQLMGVELMTQSQYIEFQELGEFDTKTSSWLSTPQEIRDKGGALFGDRRYDNVFVYHNGAQSFFNDRAFRAVLAV